MAEKLDLKYIKKESRKYDKWEEIEIEGSDGELLKFKIQKYVSNVEVSKILEHFATYLEKFSEKLYGDENVSDIQKLMIIIGHLNCFIIRFKTDIYTSKKQDKIDSDVMFERSVGLLSMSEFHTILESFNKKSIDRVRDEFLKTLDMVSKYIKSNGGVLDIDRIKKRSGIK